MKTKLENNKFDTKLESSDWRYSASIVGLMKYFEYFSNTSSPIEYDYNDDFLLYNSNDITKERYAKFVEAYYGEKLHHVVVENILKSNEEYSDEQIKLVNEKMNSNKISEKVFKKMKFNVDNKEEILNLINSNRVDLTLETYRQKPTMYRNYANTYKLFEPSGDCCRLNGYYIDMPKKGKSVGYKFETKTFVYEDEQEFDFIPFAFLGDNEAFFINDSLKIEQLYKTNTYLQDKVKELSINENSGREDVRMALFSTIIQSQDFIDYDVEIIYKNRENDYFETLYVRKEAINIFRNIKFYKAFCFSLKLNENYYLNIQKQVINCILNEILLDDMIEMFLKDEEKIRKITNRNIPYLISCFVDTNVLIKNERTKMLQSKEMEENMNNKSMINAKYCAKSVVENIDSNKIESYRQKLISAVVFKDYDRVCHILLQLSSYANVGFEFAYDLFENFEENKEIAYAFINALRKNDKSKAVGEDITNEK